MKIRKGSKVRWNVRKDPFPDSSIVGISRIKTYTVEGRKRDAIRVNGLLFHVDLFERVRAKPLGG